MAEKRKKIVEEMYKNENSRSIELVFNGSRLKKSIGLRKPPSDLLRELEREPEDIDQAAPDTECDA